MNTQYKNVLVTGAAGFIGFYLAKRLLEDGFNVILYAATKKSNELMAHTYSHLYNLPCTELRFLQFTDHGDDLTWHIFSLQSGYAAR